MGIFANLGVRAGGVHVWHLCATLRQPALQAWGPGAKWPCLPLAGSPALTHCARAQDPTHEHVTDHAPPASSWLGDAASRLPPSNSTSNVSMASGAPRCSYRSSMRGGGVGGGGGPGGGAGGVRWLAGHAGGRALGRSWSPHAHPTPPLPRRPAHYYRSLRSSTVPPRARPTPRRRIASWCA